MDKACIAPSPGTTGSAVQQLPSAVTKADVEQIENRARACGTTGTKTMPARIANLRISVDGRCGTPGPRGASISLRKLLRTGTSSRHDEGTTIIRQGDTIGSAFLIRRGLVKLVTGLPNGKERILRLQGRGAWLGLEGLLSPLSQHSAVAVHLVETFRVPLVRLHRLKDDNLQLYCRLMESWHGSLQEADLWLTEFSCGSVRGRVARLVHHLSSMSPTDQCSQVELLRCDEMAAIVASTPESVSRALAELKRRGVLASQDVAKRSARYIVNQQALQSIACE